MMPAGEYWDLQDKIEPWLDDDYDLREDAPEDVQEAYEKFLSMIKMQERLRVMYFESLAGEVELQEKIEPWLAGDRHSHEYKRLDDWDRFALVCDLKKDTPEDVRQAHKELKEKIKQWQELNEWPRSEYQEDREYWELIRR